MEKAMTTTIKVEAHCDYTTTLVEVRIDEGTSIIKDLLQDGDIKQYYVYGTKNISVREVPK